MSRKIVTRKDFQQLSIERLADADTLLNGQRWSGAYYLAGYAIELALKACVIQRLMSKDEFPEQSLLKNCYIHDLEKLMETAGHTVPLSNAIQADTVLRNNWQCVKAWTEQTRYHEFSEEEARQLIEACSQDPSGVWTWIRNYW